MKNLGLWILGGAGLVGGIAWFSRKKKTVDNMQIRISKITTNVKKLKLNDLLPVVGKGVHFRINVEVTNPTKGNLNLTKPFVKLYSNNQLVGSGEAADKNVTVKGMTKTVIDNIALNVTSDQFFTIVTKSLPSFKSKKAVDIISNIANIANQLNLEVEYSTYVEGVYYYDRKKI